MALKTTKEQLEEVQAAISAVYSGQSGSWGDKSVTMADLDAMRKWEAELWKRYNKETGATGLKRNRGIIYRG